MYFALLYIKPGYKGGVGEDIGGAQYALAAVLLQVPLTPAFWLGTGMVCGGAVLCWLATRSGRCLGDA